MHKPIRIGKMWKVLCFLVCLFFSLYMYTNNTNSLIIVGAALTKKNKGHYIQFVSFIDLIDSL